MLVAGAFTLAFVAQTTYRVLLVKNEEEQYRLLQEGDSMPDSMTLLSTEGKYSTYEEYKGKVVLVNFWAAWCGPCLKEMPSIYALHQKLQPKGFEVLGVAMDENLSQGLATLTNMAGEPPFLMLKGNEQAMANRFPIEGLPYTVIIDRKGVIRYAKPGERDWNSKEAHALLEGMM